MCFRIYVSGRQVFSNRNMGMDINRDAVKAAIKAKVIELAKRFDADASTLSDDDIIPATGFLDSSAILELVVWYESTFDLSLTQEEINIDNLGSVNAMTEFLVARKVDAVRC